MSNSARGAQRCLSTIGITSGANVEFAENSVLAKFKEKRAGFNLNH